MKEHVERARKAQQEHEQKHDVQLELTAQTHGTAVLTCRNHPKLRWTMTKYVSPEHKGPSPYMGSGTLMFDGEVGGLEANPVNVLSEDSLAKKELSYQMWYRRNYAVECNCPFTDLQLVGWIN